MTEMASLSDIDRLDNEWGFTLYDHVGEELLAFVFSSETEARSAHKMMQHVTLSAKAIVMGERETYSNHKERIWGPKPIFFLDFLWLREDGDDPLEDGWDDGLINFGLDDVRDMPAQTPLFPLKARTLEEAPAEASVIWANSKDWRPHGHAAYGYAILDSNGFTQLLFDAQGNPRMSMKAPND
jgi:hypothetical protein